MNKLSRKSRDVRTLVALPVFFAASATGCYVEPEHPRRHEVRIEEHRDEPRREHNDRDDDRHHEHDEVHAHHD